LGVAAALDDAIVFFAQFEASPIPVFGLIQVADVGGVFVSTTKVVGCGGGFAS